MSGPGVADILQRIVERRRKRLADEPGSGEPIPVEAVHDKPLHPHDNPFLQALARARGRAVIAEVKMGSPSLGSLAGTYDPASQARAYEEGGAVALSVVVEPDFFYGSYELLSICHRASGLPALAKDFVVDPLQLRWAAEAGASAVLLVASLLGPGELAGLAAQARALGLAPLVELHDFSELGRLGRGDWELVGINNRDLRTFQVEIEHGLALASTLPTTALKVAESGINTAHDIHRLQGAGYDGFLVGESLLTALDPVEKLRELLG